MEGTRLSGNWYWWTFSSEMGLNQSHTGVWCLCLMSCSQRRTGQRVTLCSALKGHPMGPEWNWAGSGSELHLGSRTAPALCPELWPARAGLCCPSLPHWNQPQQGHPAAPAVSPCSHSDASPSSVTWQPQQGGCWVLTEQTVLLWALPLNRSSQPSNCRVTLSRS